MTTTTKRRWVEVKVCPVCGANGWCTQTDDGTLALCRRGHESPHPVKQKDGTTAYLHAIHGKPIAAKVKAEAPKRTAREWEATMKAMQRAMTSRRMEIACRTLGLSEESLTEYGVGWDDTRDALAFPMRDGAEKIIGIRLRTERRKMCVPGSRNGLFIPRSFDAAQIPDPLPDVDKFAPLLLVTPEGPTDAAAAWQVGFQAIGRPFNSGGGNLLAALLARCKQLGSPRDCVIIADRDVTHWHSDNTPYWPGWEGAVHLAGDVLFTAASVRIITPPKGAKDIRQLIGDHGADGLGITIALAIEAAEVLDGDRLAWHRDLLRRVKEVARVLMAGKPIEAREAAEAEARRLVREGKSGPFLKMRRAG